MNWLLFISFNFALYSFFGWVIEEFYSYVSRGYFKADGFLSIPFKPMYGLAMCILIYCYYRLDIGKINLVLLSLLVPTIVEFISGYMLLNIFNKQFWDYSSVKFNYQGLICIKFSICWTVLSVLTILYLQPLVMRFYNNFLKFNNIVALMLVLYIIIDFTSIGIQRVKEIASQNKISDRLRQVEISEKKSS